MNIERINESINKAEEDGGQLSHVSWLGSSGGNWGTVGTNCRLADVLSTAIRARRGGGRYRNRRQRVSRNTQLTWCWCRTP